MNFIITEKQALELKNKLNENPDSVDDYQLSIHTFFDDNDAIAFGFYEGHAFVGFNKTLTKNCNSISDSSKSKIYDNYEYSIGCLLSHQCLHIFYRLINYNFFNVDSIPHKRNGFDCPGRLWFKKKVISFWRYPNPDELYNLLTLISKEVYLVYGFKIDFSDFMIEVKYEYNNVENENAKTLIPIKNYVGSSNSSDDEMAKMHVMPSAEKQKTPQMKAALKAKYDAIGNKLGSTPQAKYNFYKNYGMGDSKIINKENLKNKINETPEEIKDKVNEIYLDFEDSDALAFGLHGNHAFVGFNNELTQNCQTISNSDKKEIYNGDFSLKWLATHDDIKNFYSLISYEFYEIDKIPNERQDYQYPGRLWYTKKVISFWRYPKPNELTNLLNLLSKEINLIYGFKIDFNEYQIEIKNNGENLPLNNEYAMDWNIKNKVGTVIPIKDYIGSSNSSDDEMAKMHVMPSAEKQKTPQMKAALKAKYDAIGDKLGSMPQAKYNFYKNYGLGDSKITSNDKLISEESNSKVIYSAIFVDKDELLNKFTPIHENIFYDHSTIEFNPKDTSNLPIGKKVNVKIKGRLTTDKVDALLVDNKFSSNEYPHITLSTADGVKPFESNSEIKNNLDKIVKLNDNINGIIGVFTNNGIIDEDINIPVNTGDTVLMGKFKNKKTIVKDIGKDAYNMPTINGKKAATFRMLENDDLLSEVSDSEVDLSSFEKKASLNPKVWPSKNKINPKVRIRLLKIADDFIDSIKIKNDLCEDIVFVGSLSNYNWSKYSDIDLHIIIDFSKISEDKELVKDYFDSKRTIWNNEHSELKIYGFPVEVYIQDLSEKNVTTSIYSLIKNKWLKIPDPDSDYVIESDKIKIKSADIMTKIDDLENRLSSNKSTNEIENISSEVKTLFDKVKKIRKSGLESKNGEFSFGNIIFKVLRRSNYIEKLVDLKRNTYDKINTIK